MLISGPVPTLIYTFGGSVKSVLQSWGGGVNELEATHCRAAHAFHALTALALVWFLGEKKEELLVLPEQKTRGSVSGVNYKFCK